MICKTNILNNSYSFFRLERDVLLVDIEQLNTFLLVANTKSFTRTAEISNVVQSTVTSRIQMLERQLGKELFWRDKRNIRLTKAGQIFLPYAERIMELSNEGVKSVQLDQSFTTQIIIGTTHAVWDYVLYNTINKFQRLHQDISLSMKTEHSNNIIRKMIDGLIDIGIVFYPVQHANIVKELIIEDTFILVTDPSCKISKRPISPSDLKNLPYIHLDWGGSFSSWFRQEIGNQFVSQLEVDHVSLMLKFITSKQGFGFIPYSVAKGLIQKRIVTQVPFESKVPIPNRSLYLLRRKHNNSIKHIEKLTDYFKNEFY